MGLPRKILVLGCGSIGKRHLRNLLSISAGELAACDVDDKKRDGVREEFSLNVFPSLEQALAAGKYDAALICTPPSYHVGQALELLDMGVHCFVEKPLSDTMEYIEKLAAVSKSSGKTVMVGYMFRFSTQLKRIKTMIDGGAIGKILSVRASVGYYLPYWRPQEDYREGYGAKRELGGGIILDASHEIDYVRYLAGEIVEVFAVSKKLSSLEIETEDFAEITLRLAGGGYAQIHLDYLQSSYRRSCEFIGEKGLLLWDLNERTLRHHGLQDREYHLYYEGLNANVNDMYFEEIRHFLACTEGKATPPVSLRDEIRVQKIIAKIKESSARGQLLAV